MTTDIQLSFTARTIATIRTEFEDMVRQTRPDVWSDFFESNLGQSLIELNAMIGDMISMGQDFVGGEFFLATCLRYESALRFCRSVGYVPRSATSAEVLVRADVIPTIVTINGATIPLGTVISSGGLQYELLEDVVLSDGPTVATLSLFEGQSFSETFDPSNQGGQEVLSANGVVAEGSWHVFVGDASDPDNEWDQVEKVAFEIGATETYEISFDGDGRIHVVFGDGIAGKIPDDTITLQYRTTAGAGGNAPIYSIRGNVKANVTGGLGTASIAFENSTSASSGGRDRESLEELRVNVPAYIRSADKVLTLNDYNTNLLRVSGVALVYADILVASYAANIVRIYVWADEEVDFVSETYDATVSSTAEYLCYAQFSATRINDVQEWLRGRTSVNILNVIYRPTISYADVYLTTVVYDSRYVKETIHENITKAIIAVFEGSTGFAIRVSDLYNAIDTVAGVKNFYIERIVWTRLAKDRATGSIALSDQPTDGDTITIDDGSGAKTFEFDDDESVTGGNIDVPIGATTAITVSNLRLLINSNLNITALTDPDDPLKLDLTHNEAGEEGNEAITKVGAVITVTGMSGGTDTPTEHIRDYRRIQEPSDLDQWPSGTYDPKTPASGYVRFLSSTNPSDAELVVIGDGTDTVTFEFEISGGVSGDNVAVIVGATAADTMDNLKTAIEANLDITATIDGESSDPKVDLENNTSGDIGNVDITTTGAQIEVSGMDGGGDIWRDGGQPPYLPIQDVRIEATLGSRRFYDETYLYNNEIYYDAGAGEAALVQALNLRRLIMDLVAG